MRSPETIGLPRTALDPHPPRERAAERDVEAELAAQLESLSPDAARLVLEELASAVFPGGIGDLSQLTWEATTAPPAAPASPAAAADTDPRDDPDARLRVAELRFRTLIEQIPAVTFMAVLGEGKNDIYVSPHIESLLGFTQKEWLENPFLWYSQLHPDDRSIWLDEFARGCRTGGPFRAECRFLSRDGRHVWVRGEARLVKDERGRPLFLQGVAFDITESKRAQEIVLRKAVRTTEERYHNLVERLGAIFWEADPRTRGFTFVSEGAERILGFPRTQWVEHPEFWFDRVHPDDRERVYAAWHDAFDRRQDRELEFRAIAADGTTVWLHQQIHFPAADAVFARPLGVILNITERKRFEQELARALGSEQLARSEAEALNRVGQTLAGELDLQQLGRQVASVGMELTGAEWAGFWHSDRTGSSPGMFLLARPSPDPGAPPSFSFADPRLIQALGGASARIEDLSREWPTDSRSDLVRALGSRSYLGVPVISRSGEVLGGLFFGHSDPGRFTERHQRLIEGFAAQSSIAVDNARLYDDAESARRAAESANRAKDEFLATISHELRTPLNAVLGWTQVLQSMMPNEETRTRALAAIERNARAQSQIIEDLLDVSRIVSGVVRLEIEPVLLAGLVEGVLETVAVAAEKKRIMVTRRLDPTAVVRGDAHRLRQVVNNLLVNAVKFTPEEGRIDVTLDRERGLARIRIADTGQGIDPAFLPHVFDRFRQADSSTSRAHGGLGLGLAIVRHLTDLHGGSVRAESPGLGLGATFTVEIPLDPASDEPSGGADGGVRDSAAAAIAAIRGARVLVVDDDPDSLELLVNILEISGATVSSARSVREAIRIASRSRFDLLLCDLAMPEQDGLDFIRRVRESGGINATTPAAAVTALARDEDRQRALMAGFNGYIAKPIDAAATLGAISNLIARKRA